jgi:hypothetical protein
MTTAVVTSEPRVYVGGGRSSYVADLARASLPDCQTHREAVRRLERYGEEVRYEIERRSAFGQVAMRALRESVREAGELRSDETEVRAASSLHLASTTAPSYLQSAASECSSTNSFPGQARGLPLPSSGSTVYLASLRSPEAAPRIASDNGGSRGGLGPSDDVEVPVVSLAGQVVLPQQLLDGDHLLDASFDVLAATELVDDLTRHISRYCIGIATKGAGRVDEPTPLTVSVLLANLATATDNMARTTSRTHVRASHVFMTSQLDSWITKQTDSSDRPVVVPSTAGILTAEPLGDPARVASGWTGYHLNGLAAFVDDNLERGDGGREQVLAACMDQFLLWTSPVISGGHDEPGGAGGQAGAVVEMRQNVAACMRDGAAIQQISGTGYENLI